MSQKFKLLQLGLVLVLLSSIVLTGCGIIPPEPKNLTPRHTRVPPPVTIPFPTDTSPPEDARVHVSDGATIIIDGSFMPGEWNAALKFDLDHGGELLISSDQDNLYLGLQSAKMSYGSICVVQGDQIRILHSSAALGSAIYEQDVSNWTLTQEFSWCCRSTSSGSEKETLYNTEGWLASTGRMGTPNQMEYQLKLGDDPLTLAVVFQEVVGESTIYWWPQTLDDGCLALVKGGGTLPETLEFFPDTWEAIVLER